jgi:replicative DNA helicase
MSGGDADRLARAIALMVSGTRAPDTVRTGYPSIDNALGGGLRRGDLVVLGGEVGSGKSALALAIALRAGQSGARVMFRSGEMDPARIAERALAIEARVRVDDIRRGALDDDARSKLTAVSARVERQLPGLATIDAEELATSEEPSERFRGTDLLVIDPLQALARGARSLEEDVAVAARALKRLAVMGDLCVLATSHLPLLERGRKDPRPQLDDFGALGTVKQFADVVLGLYRHEMYDSAPDVDGATELIVLKNRNGARGYVDLYFYKQWMRFEDMLEPDR